MPSSDEEEDKGLVTDEQFLIPFKDLRLDGEIGTGSFGKVLVGTYFGTKVAIKKLFDTQDPFMKKYIQREMQTLKNIRHPNIVQFMGVCLEKKGKQQDVYIITEFVDGGDLSVKIDDPNQQFSWKKVVKIAQEVATAMAFLHARNIIHRDLKTTNLLLEAGSWKVKVCDFGMARKAESKKYANMTLCGTDAYMAPEVIMGEAYDVKADVFSFGICLAETITRQPAIERSINSNFGFDWKRFNLYCPLAMPKGLHTMLHAALSSDPTERPTFVQILSLLEALLSEVDESPILYPVVESQSVSVNSTGTTVAISSVRRRAHTSSSVLDEGSGSVVVRPDSVLAAEPARPAPALPPKSPRVHGVATESTSEDAASTPAFTASTPSARAARRTTIGSQREATFNSPSSPISPSPISPSSSSPSISSPVSSASPSDTSNSPGFKRVTKASSLISSVREFHSRVGEGVVSAVKEFLAMNPGFDVDAVGDKGETAVYVATKYGHVEMLQYTLSLSNKSVNLPAQTDSSSGSSFPIHQACKKNTAVLVRTLLEQGAKVKVLDGKKNYPLHVACEAGNYETVDLLLQHDFSILEMMNEEGETPLLLCCRLGHLPICSLLIKNGADPRVQDRKGRTPLWHISALGNLSLVEAMIAKNAAVDVADVEEQATPLWKAIRAKDLEMSLLLIKHGADASRYRKHTLGPTPDFRNKIIEAAQAKGVVIKD